MAETYLRGARSFLQGRFESALREPFDDGTQNACM